MTDYTEVAKRWFSSMESEDSEKPPKQLLEASVHCVDGFFLAHDNSDPPQLWVWRGQPGDEAAEPLVRVQK